MSTTQLSTTCCIVGGGPAGMMLGLLLARSGVDVTVLEKHADFNRDFRGDTVHPATLEVFHELGLLDELLHVPHQQFAEVSGVFGGELCPVADFTHLPVHAKFIALMPQWDLLNFAAAVAKRYPNFHLRLAHKVTDLLRENGRVTGARAESAEGTVEVRAPLTVGCDGRHAVTTSAEHLGYVERGVPIDVLWFRLSRRPEEPENGLGYLNFGRMMVLINRGDYFQIGYIIRKDAYATEIQPAGLAAFRQHIGELAPFLAAPGADGRSQVDELTSWDQVKLLTVQVNRLRHWHVPGLLCIGDAAHAMSPVGGIGINLAIQDAVAAANLLAEPLRTAARTGFVSGHALARVQHRREFPTRLTQAMQVRVHGFLDRFLGHSGPMRTPFVARLARRYARVRRLAGRFIGMGVRPEHVSI